MLYAISANVNVHKQNVFGPSLCGYYMAKKRKAKRIGRPMPVQNVVNTGPLAEVGSGSTGDWYVNAAHLLSMMNRKAFHQVTKSGHLKNYGLEVQVFNCVNASTAIRTAPLAYPTYNATRAWHFARKERYADAGFKLSDLGYGSRLRFALNYQMSNQNQSTSTMMIKPAHLNNTVVDKGEWDWSDVIITPPMEGVGATQDVHADDLIDGFKLHLCGDHTEEADNPSLKFSHVGMIQSWTENRRGWAEPSDDEVIQPENPLAFARMSESSSMEITREVADEQKQSPPYSNDDDDTSVSVFADTVLQGQLESKFPNPTTNNDMIVAPGGVAKISITNNDSAAAYPYVYLRIVELD